MLVISCKELFFDDPANTSETNFEIFWSDFNKYYAHFKVNGINWDSVYLVNRPRVNAQTSSEELYNVLEEIIASMNDGHVNLYTPFATASCQDCIHDDYPSSGLINPFNYLVPGPRQPNIEIMEYRMVSGHNIGYILLKQFSGDESSFGIIDTIIDEFRNTNGIIIDVRGNGGGNSNNAEIVASRFADKKRLYSRYIVKVGAGENDFSDWYDVFITPAGDVQYSKPVVVLTSRKTFSSAEGFVLAMRELPNTTIVGDTTGGGMGSPVYRELPNGWVFRLSTKLFTTKEYEILENIGIAPDITEITTRQDSIDGIDRILERGIEVIEN